MNKDDLKKEFKKYFQEVISPRVVNGSIPYLSITDLEADWWLSKLDAYQSSLKQHERRIL